MLSVFLKKIQVALLVGGTYFPVEFRKTRKSAHRLTAGGLQKRSVFDQRLKRVLTLMPKFELYQTLTVCFMNQALFNATLINKIEFV